jgi:hypothetical protein
MRDQGRCGRWEHLLVTSAFCQSPEGGVVPQLGAQLGEGPFPLHMVVK